LFAPVPVAAGREKSTRPLLLCLVVGAIGIVELRAATDRSFVPGDEEVAAGTLADAIVGYVRRHATPKVLLQIDGPAWPVAAGVAVQLEKAGVPYAVDKGAVWMFGNPRAPAGDERLTIAISGARRHDALGRTARTVALAERRNFYADILAP
jgi:hypothetical protein